MRIVFRITGKDAVPFLQGLVTNDVTTIAERAVYAALLTPQGKYIADFFLAQDGEAILLDVDHSLADMLETRLNMYRLRAEVRISRCDLQVAQGLGTPPAGALSDPRHPALGWRLYTETPPAAEGLDWDALRVEHVIPQSGIELTPDSFILEAGFERLNGVDFRKGCYVGQEVTARMKHKTELRKGLAQVGISGSAPVGTPITAGGKAVGTLYTRSGDKALAYLRYDRAGAEMQAGDATLSWTDSRL